MTPAPYEGLRRLYSQNGAGGDNERHYVTKQTTFDPAWNPTFCVYGWPHLVWPGEPDVCHRCGAQKASGTNP